MCVHAACMCVSVCACMFVCVCVFACMHMCTSVFLTLTSIYLHKHVL